MASALPGPLEWDSLGPRQGHCIYPSWAWVEGKTLLVAMETLRHRDWDSCADSGLVIN